MGAKEFERPFSMRGLTTKIKTPHGSMFVTINFFEGEVREVFVVVSKPGSEIRACAEALGRVISLALQKGIPAEDVVETLENIKTEEVSWNRIDGKSFPVSSIPDGIAKAIKFALSLKNPPDIAIKNYMKNDRISNAEKNPDTVKPKTEKKTEEAETNGKVNFSVCPDCHSNSLTFQEGCYICMNCGYTKCS